MNNISEIFEQEKIRLEKQYKRFLTEKLYSIWNESGLTPAAELTLYKELRNRGLAAKLLKRKVIILPFEGDNKKEVFS